MAFKLGRLPVKFHPSFAVKHGYSKMEAKKLFTGQVPE
jgi:hypothetical protein